MPRSGTVFNIVDTAGVWISCEFCPPGRPTVYPACGPCPDTQILSLSLTAQLNYRERPCLHLDKLLFCQKGVAASGTMACDRDVQKCSDDGASRHIVISVHTTMTDVDIHGWPYCTMHQTYTFDVVEERSHAVVCGSGNENLTHWQVNFALVEWTSWQVDFAFELACQPVDLLLHFAMLKLAQKKHSKSFHCTLVKYV